MTLWYAGWRVSFHPAYQSSIQNNKYEVSHKYSCFSWWWAHSRPKHVKKRTKHTKKNYAQSWLYLQDLKYLGSVARQKHAVYTLQYIELSHNRLLLVIRFKPTVHTDQRTWWCNGYDYIIPRFESQSRPATLIDVIEAFFSCPSECWELKLYIPRPFFRKNITVTRLEHGT